MAAISLQVDRAALDRELRRLEAKMQALATREVPRAQARALNTAAARTQTGVRRELAQVKHLPQKVLKKRVQYFRAYPRKLVARVWVGLKNRVLIENLPGARQALTGKFRGMLRAGAHQVKTFEARLKNGKRAQFVRAVPGLRRTAGRPLSSPPNLPIVRPHIPLQPEAERLIQQHGANNMRHVYPRELGRLLERAAAKLGAS